jgi:transposase-like protein
MLQEFKSLPDLLDYFKDKETCLQYWENIRWKNGVKCLHCGHEKVYRTNRGFKCAHPDCRKKFSATVGSIFENSKLSLRIWFGAMYMICNSKKGASAYQVARQFNIGIKAAWYISHRIRKSFSQAAVPVLSGTISADESWVGGKNKNRHWDKKVKNSAGRGALRDKTPVLGALEEETGKVRCWVIPNTNAGTIQPIILKHIQTGSTLYTDEWQAYWDLDIYYDHHTVDHSRKQYKNGKCTTNPIESFWSHLKRKITGVHHRVSPKHLQRYCDEIAYQFNHRELSNKERFEISVENCAGVRLKYKSLIE